jgi:hypothetical protein
LAKLFGVSASGIKKLNGIRNRSLQLSVKRNRVAHDPWSYGSYSKSHYRLEKTARSKLDHTFKLVSEDDLKAIQGEIVKLEDDFIAVRNDVLFEP